MADPVELDLGGGLAVAWDEAAISALVAADSDAPRWELRGTPGDDVAAIRVLSASYGDGNFLVLASARPREADGHDAEEVATVIENADGRREIFETLLSTEYGAGGNPRRITLEMYPKEDSYPLRGAGDASGETQVAERDGMRTESAELDFRLAGERGRARYEILHRD